MQPELTLNTKCPACGSLKPKTLAAIKAQTVFECDCGFHAPIQALTSQAPAKVRKREVTATA